MDGSVRIQQKTQNAAAKSRGVLTLSTSHLQLTKDGIFLWFLGAKSGPPPSHGWTKGLISA